MPWIGFITIGPLIEKGAINETLSLRRNWSQQEISAQLPNDRKITYVTLDEDMFFALLRQSMHIRR